MRTWIDLSCCLCSQVESSPTEGYFVMLVNNDFIDYEQSLFPFKEELHAGAYEEVGCRMHGNAMHGPGARGS